MKHLFSIIVLSMAAVCPAAAQKQTAGGYPYSQVPFTSVKIAPASFWGQRLKAVREVTIPLAFSKCKSEGRYDNFVKAAHPSDKYDVGSFMGFPFDDTDVYKTIEGASYILQTYPDKRMKLYIDSVLDIVSAAQEPDGYLYTARTINPKKPHPWSGPVRWSKEEVLSHELYNLGHMVDAACAHYQATGSTKFLDIARRYADCVIKEVGPGKDQATVVPGHQIAEMALARLYVLTGEKKYLDEAKYFLDYRGRTKIHDVYTQSNKPVTEQTEAWGHAVRAGYMYAGMADIAALTGDSAYIKAIDRIWGNIVGKKYYITGGVGARHAGEAFGADYELPNLTAYNETCAAIAQCYLNLRLFMLHGDAKYIDCLERTLYNGVISGMSVDGGRFFYPNPLSSDGKYAFNSDNTTTRQPWFGCACCPSNLSRFIPSVPGYMYGVRGNDIYVNLYAAGKATVKSGGKDVVISQQTDYPWNGDIKITIEKCAARGAALKLRIPGWVRNSVTPGRLYAYNDGLTPAFSIKRGGKTIDTKSLDKGYITVGALKKGDVIEIHFDMPVRTVTADSHVQADRGCIAVERGPLVYCAEAADNGGGNVWKTIMPQHPQFSVVSNYKIDNTESHAAPFEVNAVTTTAQTTSVGADGRVSISDTKLTLIPYYAWNHRGADYMEVWLSCGDKALEQPN